MRRAREGETQIVVPSGDSKIFSSAVQGPAIVTWGMRVVEYNVVYKAVFEPEQGDVMQLGATTEGSKDDHAAGVFTAPGPGKLLITLGNEHSWMRKKCVFVSVDIVPQQFDPDQDNPEPEPYADDSLSKTVGNGLQELETGARNSQDASEHEAVLPVAASQRAEEERPKAEPAEDDVDLVPRATSQ